MNEIKAILFDFDGVVIDSEPVHAKAKRLVLEKFNIPFYPELLDDFKGIPDKAFFEYVSIDLDKRKHTSEFLYNSKKSIFEEIITEIKLVDGFFHFLQNVKKKGVTTALVSSTSLYSLGLVDKHFNISSLFDLVITEVDTEKHKPDPDPYLKALQILSAGIRSTVVIEDSPNGIISAKSADCFVFGLTSSFQSSILIEAGADEVVGSFAELWSKLTF